MASYDARAYDVAHLVKCRTGSILAAGDSRLVLPRQMGGGVDNRGVRKRLRKIAEKTLRDGVVFLGEEAEIVSEGKQAVEQFHGVRPPADQVEAVGEPKAAGKKNPFTRGQSIGALTGAISIDKAVGDEVLLNRCNGAKHPRVVGRQKPELRDQQQRSVDLSRAVILDEGVSLAIVGAFEDLIGDAIADFAPVIARSFVTVLLNRFDAAVERDPGHHLGKGKMTRPAAHLPDPLIGLGPGLFQEFEQLELQVPGIGAGLEPKALARVQRIHQLAVNIELELVGSRISDAYRPTAGVAREPVDFIFGQAALTRESVHDLHLGRMTGNRPQQPLAPGPGLPAIS